jgi:hypothetical protein
MASTANDRFYSMKVSTFADVTSGQLGMSSGSVTSQRNTFALTVAVNVAGELVAM